MWIYGIIEPGLLGLVCSSEQVIAMGETEYDSFMKIVHKLMKALNLVFHIFK